MKHIKSYNESVRQYLKPKSNEEILNILSTKSNKEKIKKIIEYQLDYSLLPRNIDGFCVYDGNLWCNNKNLTKLPDNLFIDGYLDCSNNELTELPDNLVVNGYLWCDNNKLTELPDNLVVKCVLYCNTLPKNIEKPKGVNRIEI